MKQDEEVAAPPQLQLTWTFPGQLSVQAGLQQTKIWAFPQMQSHKKKTTRFLTKQLKPAILVVQQSLNIHQTKNSTIRCTL